jgi:hypothetical protein
MKPASPFFEPHFEARRLWTAALRSNEYPPSRVFLTLIMPTGEARYCCMGVACELFRERYPEMLQASTAVLCARGYACREFADNFELNQRFFLPEMVRRWLGLADRAGTFRQGFEHLGYGSLAEMGDEGRPFNELADLIDADAVRLADRADDALLPLLPFQFRRSTWGGLTRPHEC